MNIDFTQQVYGLDGKAFTNDNNGNHTLSSLVTLTLLASYNDEAGLGGEDKFKRFELASKIKDSSGADVSAEDIVLIKKLVGKMFPPGVVGPIYLMLEGRSAPKLKAVPASDSAT